MRYAKLINACPQYWSGHTTIDGKDIFTNDPRPYGWKIVDETQPEQREGYYVVYDGWTEDETYIRQTYHYEPIPEPEPTLEDRVETLEENVDDIINGVTE